MSAQQTIRATLAAFLKVDPAALTPEYPLSGPRTEGSVARYALDAALRRATGIKSAAVYTAKTVGELEAALLGGDAKAGAASHAPAASPPVPQTANGVPIACGIDIELAANLPETSDPWEHPFYRAHFSKAEIAYCLTQERPAMHFAARWCAKEALKKCAPDYLNADMAGVEVERREDGAVQLVDAETKARLPFALSMAHTPESAVAVVIRVNLESPAPFALPPSPTEETRRVRRSRLQILAPYLALAALLLSFLALCLAIR